MPSSTRAIASRALGQPSGSIVKKRVATCAMMTSEIAASVTRTPLNASGSITLVAYFTDV